MAPSLLDQRSLDEPFQQIVVTKLSTNFEEATQIQKVSKVSELVKSLKPNEIIVKHHYWGINASDINFTAGRYDRNLKPPFAAGFEGIGEVVAIGDQVKNFALGDKAVVMGYGAFSEYQVSNEQTASPVPDIRPEYLSLVSSLTSYIALSVAAKVSPGDTVLVTAASGGTGQFAVQFAKRFGAKVIGTCGSDEKVKYLKSIGCDRPVNYKTEDLDQVLQNEFPKGVDVVFESVGGSMLQTILKRMAIRGRVLIIGAISSYAEEDKKDNANADGAKQSKPLAWQDSIPTALLLSKSISLIGFFLPQWMSQGGKQAIPEIISGIKKGEIHVQVEMQDFSGLQDIKRGINFLHSGKNVGKVVVPATAQLKKSSI